MFKPIGFVRTIIKEKVDRNWGGIVSDIVINDDLADGLEGLSNFSHVIIVYHLSEAKFDREKHLLRKPQERVDMPLTGIFSQRAKDRPNPIGITSVKIISVEQNVLRVGGLDAIDGTPVLDVKPYYPQYDRRDATVPEWVNILMKDYF